MFPQIGREGQEKLLASRVLIVGCGALGASHAEMLARAGVGNLRIVDRDFVEFSNLQRQTLYSESDAADRLPKAVAARDRIAAINSETQVEPIVADVNNSNIESLISECDVVIDGTDNFQVRYLVNDACVKHGTPWIYGAAVASYGTTMTIRPGETPCLRCIFEEMPDAGSSPTCDTAGVIMPIIASISAIQVAECLKLLVGDTASLHGSLIHIDLWANDWRQIKLPYTSPESHRSPQGCGSPRVSKGETAAADCTNPHDSTGTDSCSSPRISKGETLTADSETAPARQSETFTDEHFAPDCICCGKRQFEFLDAEMQEFAAVLCGRDAVQIAPPRPTELDLTALAARLAAIPDVARHYVKQNDHLVRFTVEPSPDTQHEITVFRDARAIIKGIDDPTAARSIYTRYIGN